MREDIHNTAGKVDRDVRGETRIEEAHPAENVNG
jgi:hypothetical protein